MLGQPDPHIMFYLDIDASAVGMGAVLSQVQQGSETFVAFYSKTLNRAEQNYCVTRRKLLPVIKTIKHF